MVVRALSLSFEINTYVTPIVSKWVKSRRVLQIEQIYLILFFKFEVKLILQRRLQSNMSKEEAEEADNESFQ